MENIMIQDNPTTSTIVHSPLRQTVEIAIKGYFDQMGDQAITNLYDMVLAEVEEPLLKSVMEQTRGNQSKAAILLGLSRGTLRKKLKAYDLL